MTKAEVKATQPTRNVSLSPACTGYLNFSYDKATGLKAVEIDALKGGVAEDCPEIVLAGLTTKYGEGDRKHTITPGIDCGYGKVAQLCIAMGLYKATAGTSVTWSVLGTLIVFSVADGSDNWSVNYSVGPPPLPDASSKL